MSDHITDREYFALPAAWAILAESAKKHDREAFHRAAHMLDMEPANLMRGMGYLNYKLAHVSEDEYPYMLQRIAQKNRSKNKMSVPK